MVVKGINLLPQDLQQGEEKARAFRRASIFCILELAFLGAVVLAVYSYRSGVGNRWAVLRQEVVEQRDFINREDNRKLEGKLRVVKNKIESLKYHFEAYGTLAVFIDRFMNEIPAGVQIVALNQVETVSASDPASQATFEFSGQADNVEQVDLFVKQLKDWEEIGSVTVRTMNYQISRGVLIFSLSIKRKVS